MTNPTIMLLTISIILTALAIAFNLSWTIPTTILALTILILVYFMFERRHASSRTVALLGVLTAMIVVLRQVMHGIGASPVFFLVIIVGYLFGAVNGFVVGSTVMLISNFFVGGHGPWTPFQMIAMGMIGLMAGLLPKLKNKKVVLGLLIVYGIFAAYFYGLVTNIFFWITFASEQSMNTFIGITSAGLLQDTARAFGNTLFLFFLGPPIIKILERFRKRFYVEYIALRPESNKYHDDAPD